uniref:Uncharacterized protein n=1 Tax=Octactis speculum TaxID=3111310 RepID=A0A7S2FZ79_9STRA|mmetsp:Transcript_3440/g.3932  ORF Transcript_3440/g.3932 Transcript_3440/m.3932 type:complete len:212 (+) Transcript_3440:112-747(+)
MKTFALSVCFCCLHGAKPFSVQPMRMGGFGKQTDPKLSKPVFDGKKTFTRQMRAFDVLYKKRPDVEISDIYVRVPSSEVFWFVGKVANEKDISSDQAICTQKRLILEHGKQLQLDLKVSKMLEIWKAPGNTEVAVAQYAQELSSVERVPLDDSTAVEAFRSGILGFEPEQYEDPAKGFYVRLGNDGKPRKDRVQANIVTPDQLEGLDLPSL